MPDPHLNSGMVPTCAEVGQFMHINSHTHTAVYLHFHARGCVLCVYMRFHGPSRGLAAAMHQQF